MNYVNIDANLGCHPCHSGESVSRSLRQALRAATQDEHRALEAQSLMRRLISPELTLTEYSQIVRAQRSYYQLIEPALWPFERQLRARLPDVGYRYHSRLPALELDGRALSLSDDFVQGAEPSIFQPQSPEEALGVLYVLEGASQGGRVIRRCLNRSLALNAENGARFFSVDSQYDSWSKLCRWLEELPASGAWAEALTGAQNTFNGLKTHFDHWQRQLSDR